MIGILTAVLFMAALYLLPKFSYRKSLVMLLSFGIVLGSNLTHGVQYGLQKPIDGLGKRTNQYIHDARRIDGIDTFLPEYPVRQLSLQTHSRSHPPGAILIFYFLDRTVQDPVLISLIIAGSSVLITGLALHKLLVMFYSKSLSGYLVFATFLIPAVQIYYLSSLDALIASIMVAYFAFALSETGYLNSLAAALFLFLLSMLTFAFVFTIPVVIAYYLFNRQRRNNTFSSLLLFLVFQVIFWGATGFPYLTSFRVASALENPAGYRLLAAPANFVMTRFEGIFEWLLFGGPLLIGGTICAMRSRTTRSPFVWLPVYAGITFLAMLLAGVYRTGETARAVMFLYPLLIPAVGTLFPSNLDSVHRKTTIFAASLFFQGLLMQFIGNYFW
jgi:hypothetical protein